MNDLSRTNVVEHSILKNREKDIRQVCRKIPIHFRNETGFLIDNMLKANKIRESHSDWASHIFLIKRKDKTQRMCVDNRKLN